MRSARIWLVIAGLNGAVGVALGAYAAHGMADAGAYVADLMAKATRYQVFHALALVGIAGLRIAGLKTRLLCAAGGLMTIGILLFCGALYGIALAGWSIAFVAPFGGVSFILGWLCLSLAAFRPGLEGSGRAS